MVKKFVSYVAVTATVIGVSVLPSFADDMAGKALAFPFKVTGSSISTIWGVPLGLTKGGVEGGMKTTKIVADKMGDKECPVKTTVAAVVGGPFGVVGGAAYGSVAGAIHGAKTGYEKPFSMESFSFKED